MEYREIGDTGITVSCLSLGGNIFGYLTDKKETSKILNFALDNGVNFVDTADVYSNGVSEQYIGAAINDHRDKWIVASKIGLESYADPSFIGKSDNILKKVEESLRRLKTDYIDLYQIHHYDPVVDISETLETLDKLKTQGKIRAYGCSNYTAKQLQTSIDVAKENNYIGFCTIQRHYNLLKRKIESDIFQLCESNDLSIIAYGVLGRGVLTNKYLYGIGENTKTRASISQNINNDLTNDLLLKLKTMENYVNDNYDCSLGEFSLCWALQHNVVCSTVIGIRSIEQLSLNLSSLRLLDKNVNYSDIDSLIGELSQYDEISLGDPGIN